MSILSAKQILCRDEVLQSLIGDEPEPVGQTVAAIMQHRFLANRQPMPQLDYSHVDRNYVHSTPTQTFMEYDGNGRCAFVPGFSHAGGAMPLRFPTTRTMETFDQGWRDPLGSPCTMASAGASDRCSPIIRPLRCFHISIFVDLF